ncbi:MAG: hypothetical protein EAZ08_11630 [Cytophagales bacterium]|nr:MAG: hypothetical protein EAZ08_11630 [Cytophagales bacterium]
MKKYWFILLALGSFTQTFAQLKKASIEVNGLVRTYWYFLPTEKAENQALPLVIALHGGGGNGKGMSKLSKFHELAEKENFMVVYPDGYNNNWNDGRIGEKNKAYTANIDDVKFISMLIDRLVADFSVDKKRVFATGISNGGHLSIYLSLNLSEKILAIAPVCASIPVNLESDFKIQQPCSVLIMNGTTDKLVKYDGGEVLSGKRGEVIPTERMVQTYIKNNACAENPIIEEIADSNKKDNCKATKFIYANGKNATEVILVRIDNGGHTWADGIQYLPKFIIGNVCKDFSATDMIWEFFKRQKVRD